MKILQISRFDIMGRRFNGYDLNKYFISKGIEAHQCVWNKESNDISVWKLFDIKHRDHFRDKIELLEKYLSIQSVLYPFSLQLAFDKRFKSSDIIHYHLIHANFFSMLSLPLLTRMKPAVWTLHDPWAMTGHCVHPYNCDRWELGCGECPHLETLFPIEKDHTRLMWRLKKIIYSLSDVDIVVASKFMNDMARRSPLLSKFRIHQIPFGLDLDKFKPADSELAKSGFGIFPGSIVISFRSTTYEFKGLKYIKECLHNLRIDKPICLLTFNESGLLEEFKDKFQIIDLGWVNDQEVLVRAYNAADIFLMPSTQEAFGMMAMEAMACGKPIIVFDGTSLPEIVFAPEGGIAVPQGNVDAMLIELQQLVNNEEKRLELGRKAFELAKMHYNFTDHAEKILGLYQEVIARRKGTVHDK